jgi:WD40 repeat protein
MHSRVQSTSSFLLTAICACAGRVAPVHSIHYSADGRLLVSAGGDGSVKVWAVGDMEVLLTLQGHTAEVLQISGAGVGNVVATASEGGELAFWDLHLAAELASSLGGAVNLGAA